MARERVLNDRTVQDEPSPLTVLSEGRRRRREEARRSFETAIELTKRLSPKSQTVALRSLILHAQRNPDLREEETAGLSPAQIEVQPTLAEQKSTVAGEFLGQATPQQRLDVGENVLRGFRQRTGRLGLDPLTEARREAARQFPSITEFTFLDAPFGLRAQLKQQLGREPTRVEVYQASIDQRATQLVHGAPAEGSAFAAPQQTPGASAPTRPTTPARRTPVGTPLRQAAEQLQETTRAAVSDADIEEQMVSRARQLQRQGLTAEQIARILDEEFPSP